MQPGKKPLPARRSYEPLNELLPVSSGTTPQEEQAESPGPSPRKITLNLDGEVNEQLLAFMEEFRLTQTSVINWAIKTAIESYREGLIEAEFKPARNRIVSAR